MEVLCVDYITTKEVARNFGMLVYHCSARLINGAEKVGNACFVHVGGEKQADGWYRSSKARNGENK